MRVSSIARSGTERIFIVYIGLMFRFLVMMRLFSAWIQGNDHKQLKIVGVFYKAHEYAKDPKFLGCVENGLGLKEFLKSKGHTYILTDDKEGDNCGTIFYSSHFAHFYMHILTWNAFLLSFIEEGRW